MIKAIIFDFDGVIVESVEIKTKAFSKLFEKEGKKAVKKIVKYHKAHAGVSRFDKFKYIYKEILNRSLDRTEFKLLCESFSRIVKDEVIRAPYVRGAEEFLRDFVSIYRFYIASATPQGEIEEIIRKRNLGDFFVGVYGAPRKKTDAVKDIIGRGCYDPLNILYIGDALSDYHAAKENAIKFIARINNNEDLFVDIQCLKIKDLSRVAKIIETL